MRELKALVRMDWYHIFMMMISAQIPGSTRAEVE